MSLGADITDNAVGQDTSATEAREPDALRLALIESRQRWRQIGAMATDLVFETDARGRVTFVAPEFVLGWPAAAILGQPGRMLLADAARPDPFRFTAPVQRQPTWLRTKAGALVCMALTTIPMVDDAGRHCGVRGVAVDITEQEKAEAAAAGNLRRAEVLDHILSRLRQEVRAPRMMQSLLDTVMQALGCKAAAVVDALQSDPPLVLHAAGVDIAPVLGQVLPKLMAGGDDLQTFTLDGGTTALACPCSTRFGERAALIAWRAPGIRQWDESDRVLAGAVGGVARIILEHEAIQRELARQARTDPLTGLLNRRAFLEEAGRRLDRIEREGMPGTLLFVDVDRLKQVNDTQGHDAGDSALLLISALLQRTFRPTDLVARLGGDEFAVWLDGADSLTAAERAQSLCTEAPAELSHLSAGDIYGAGVSIGVATREPGSDEVLEQMIQRADQAMYEVKRKGGGHWRVSHRPAF